MADGYHVGVDIGGTFTDIVAVSTAGQTYRANSPTTQRDYNQATAGQVRDAARTLLDEHGSEAVAVWFLWPVADPAHEEEAKRIVSEAYPGLFVSIASEVFPVAREYERLVTTVFNAFTSKGVAEYVGALEAKLSELGCAVRPALMQAVGGLLSPDE